MVAGSGLSVKWKFECCSPGSSQVMGTLPQDLERQLSFNACLSCYLFHLSKNRGFERGIG